MYNEEQKKALEKLKNDMTLDNLWECMLLFQKHQFYTISGLPYTYEVKVGRRGEYNKELLIDRTTESKSLVWSSIKSAFQGAMEKKGEVVEKPKALGDVRGISYVYPLFYAFGLIEVPESAREKMVKI